MNKISILFLILFGSCGHVQQAKDEATTLRLKASTQVQEKVNKVIQQLRADCDSSLWQLARQRVDSIKLSKKNLKKQRAINMGKKPSKKSAF